MKLVDILARELTEWPVKKQKFVTQEGDGELYFYKAKEDACFSGFKNWWRANGAMYAAPSISVKLSHDWKKAIVSQFEWESARAAYLASIQPARDPEIAAVVDKPANPWRRNRGRKTLPVPVGTRVDVKYRYGKENYGVCAGIATDESGSNPKRNACNFEIEGFSSDIMQWRYAEPQQAQEKQMAQTIEQVIDNAEAAAAAAFNPIALRDEYKRITAEGAELIKKMGKLTDRMGDIEAALRAEGFALIDTEGK